MLIPQTRKSISFMKLIELMEYEKGDATRDYAWNKFSPGAYTFNLAHREHFIEWMCLNHPSNPNQDRIEKDLLRMQDLIPEQCWVDMNS